jgi:Protein of unknown function (DUF1186)
MPTSTRTAALDALAWLTATGQADRDETARYLRDLYMTLRPQDECYVWVGWQRAIAHLGFDELVPLVEKAFDRGWIDRGELGRSDFHNRLRAARQVAEPTIVFDSHIREDGRLDNAVSGWAAFRPQEDRMPRPEMASEIRVSDTPIRKPGLYGPSFAPDDAANRLESSTRDRDTAIAPASAPQLSRDYQPRQPASLVTSP